MKTLSGTWQVLNKYKVPSWLVCWWHLLQDGPALIIYRQGGPRWPGRFFSSRMTLFSINQGIDARPPLVHGYYLAHLWLQGWKLVLRESGSLLLNETGKYKGTGRAVPEDLSKVIQSLISVALALALALSLPSQPPYFYFFFLTSALLHSELMFPSCSVQHGFPQP